MDSAKVIARRARKIVERFAKQHPEIGNPKNLSCYCAIGSWILFHLASQQGYEPKFIKGTFCHPKKNYFCEHCWIEIDYIAYDITATQFGFEQEVLTKNPIRLEGYVVENIYHKQDLSSDFLADWEEQSPIVYKTELLELMQNYHS